MTEKSSGTKKDEKPEPAPVRDPSMAIPPDILPRYLQPKKLL